VLQRLVALRGKPISRCDLANELGVVDGGSFSSRISEVRRTGLLSDNAGKGMIAANRESLFL
jgi:CRP-like cAMP-binding protein